MRCCRLFSARVLQALSGGARGIEARCAGSTHNKYSQLWGDLPQPTRLLARALENLSQPPSRPLLFMGSACLSVTIGSFTASLFFLPFSKSFHFRSHFESSRSPRTVKAGVISLRLRTEAPRTEVISTRSQAGETRTSKIPKTSPHFRSRCCSVESCI